ncbi:MAG: hypothetical protein JO030_03330 [Candidatus Eremiobacteraeota bacterium]|nr:hypothetical protein [Candidatus Eremiobacteraeota bacterium]
MRLRLSLFLFIAAAAIAACGGAGWQGNGSPGTVLPEAPLPKKTSPIKHVIVVIQENRSFDNFFATFPGANGTLTGQAAPMPTPIQQSCAARQQPVITQPTTVPLAEVSITGKGFKDNFGWNNDLDHIYLGYYTELDGGKMDGFDLVNFGPDGESQQAECTYAYQYVDPVHIGPYWDIAKQYVLADNTFTTQGSSSFTGHQDLIAGGTAINATQSIIDNPTNTPWGCDSPPNTKTSLIINYNTYLKYLRFDGPFPCFTYRTLRDTLDAKKVSWKYYAVQVKRNGDGIWSAFDAIQAVRKSPEWLTNVTSSPKVIFDDISESQLPAVAWVTPNAPNSDHPYVVVNGKPTDLGPSWVASVVNAIGQSPYWKSTAIVVVWDDSGGFYDHVKPAFIDTQGGLGFRVPMLIVSPYVQPHVEHTQYEFGSIVKFIEETFGLPSLGTTDKRATSIGNAFDFKQKPRQFKKIASKYSIGFFRRQNDTDIPVDTR